MFYENQKVVVDGAGNVVLLLVEENAFKGVNVQLVGICVVSAKDGVTKRKKPRRVVEVRPKNRVTITSVIIRY